MIYQLVYVSRAAGEMGDVELDDILAQAREKNIQADVTGMLLYHQGSFIQVLEGDQATLEQLYTKIEQDSRHVDANVVLRAQVDERAFEGWSMGYKRADSLSDVPEGFHYFLKNGYRRKTDADNNAARKALLAFREGRWRKN